jgi:hypothetical protein
MGFSSSETLLIGALLDRLGDTQAQALLERMGNWLQHDRETRPKTSGLSRRRAEIGNHHLRENKASQMRKDYSS